jgi:hypothetical protein
MRFSQLTTLIAEHERPAMLALAVGTIVRLVKDKNVFPFAVAPRWRPCVALGLGAVGGAVESFVTGVPLPGALLRGLGSGCLAIAAHDTLIEGLRGGRELFASSSDKDRSTDTISAGPAVPAAFLAGAHALVAVGRVACQRLRPASASVTVTPAGGRCFRILFEFIV